MNISPAAMDLGKKAAVEMAGENTALRGTFQMVILGYIMMMNKLIDESGAQAPADSESVNAFIQKQIEENHLRVGSGDKDLFCRSVEILLETRFGDASDRD